MVLLAIKDAFTNAVVAICVLISPVTGVGAVGVPVKDGDAIVALNAISLVFVVMLAVLAVILFVLVVTLASIAVILFVFDTILVGKVAIVAELTPPTVFTLGASAVPPKSFAN
jgi:hypothetical protein